jgi:hypothetical protein
MFGSVHSNRPMSKIYTGSQPCVLSEETRNVTLFLAATCSQLCLLKTVHQTSPSIPSIAPAGAGVVLTAAVSFAELVPVGKWSVASRK